MKQKLTALTIFGCLVLGADTLVLKDGRTVEGDYLGGSPRSIRVQVGDRVQTFDVNEVSEIRFGNGTKAAPEPPAPPPSQAPPPSEPPPAAARTDDGILIPEGTTLSVRMIDDIDSERDSVGQTFKGSVDEPLQLNGRTIVPRGADVTLKLIDDKQSGKLSGRTELTLDVVSLVVDGQTVEVSTEAVTHQSESRTGRTAKVVGGTAALGAIIGAIAGGGRGAAIGGLSGAAAGGAVQVMTRGQRVRIPSETRLTFTVQHPVRQ